MYVTYVTIVQSTHVHDIVVQVCTVHAYCMQTCYDVHLYIKMVWDSKDITRISYLYLLDISSIRTAAGLLVGRIECPLLCSCYRKV